MHDAIAIPATAHPGRRRHYKRRPGEQERKAVYAAYKQATSDYAARLAARVEAEDLWTPVEVGAWFNANPDTAVTPRQLAEALSLAGPGAVWDALADLLDSGIVERLEHSGTAFAYRLVPVCENRGRETL